MKLTVSTGGESWDVEADSPMAAFIKAIKTYGFDKIGLIATITPTGKPDITQGGNEGWIISTERGLQEAGIEYARTDGGQKMSPVRLQ